MIAIRPQIFRCGNMFPSEARLLGFVVRNLIDKSYRGNLERLNVVAKKKGPHEYNGPDPEYSAGGNP